MAEQNHNGPAVNIQGQQHLAPGVAGILEESRERWLDAGEIESIFLHRARFILSGRNPPVNTEGLYFYNRRAFIDSDSDWVRVNGIFMLIEGDHFFNLTQHFKPIEGGGNQIFRRRTHRHEQEYGRLALVHYRRVEEAADE